MTEYNASMAQVRGIIDGVFDDAVRLEVANARLKHDLSTTRLWLAGVSFALILSWSVAFLLLAR